MKTNTESATNNDSHGSKTRLASFQLFESLPKMPFFTLNK